MYAKTDVPTGVVENCSNFRQTTQGLSALKYKEALHYLGKIQDAQRVGEQDDVYRLAVRIYEI